MQESINQILEVDDGYLITGYSDFGRTKLIISKLDLNGDTIWLKKYGTDSLWYQPGYRNAMIRCGASNFALAVNFTDYDGDYWSRMMIIKFNSNGDTIWSNQLYTPDSIKRYCHTQGIIETMDKGFLVYGSENYLSGVLIKTDSLGNTEWLKYYGNYMTADSRQIFDVRQTQDSGYIAAGYQQNLHDIKSGDARIIRFDKSGNKMWDKVFGSEFEDYTGANIQPVNDTEFMVVAHYTTLTSGTPHFFPQGNRLNVIRISADGEILENYLRGDEQDHPWISDLEIMGDGSFISCGSDIYGSSSWIYNFSIEKDSLFFRKINPSYSPGTIRFINDIKSTSDGGIIACGEYTTVINSTYIRHPWIIKTDRYGCVDMGCDSNGIYITGQPVSTTTCKRAPVLLISETLNMAGNVNYAWQHFYEGAWQNIEDEVIYQGFNNDTLIIDPVLLESQIESYRCNLNNEYWSLCTDSVAIYFLDTIDIILQPQPLSVHFSDLANFQVAANGSHPIEYQWFHNDQLIEGENDSILLIHTVIEKDTGTYYCKMTNECGEIESENVLLKIDNLGVDDEMDKFQISINPNPTAGLLNICVPGEFLTGRIRLLDLSGRPINVVVNYTGNSEYKLDLTAFSPGIYFLEIQMNNKDELIRRIIKK